MDDPDELEGRSRTVWHPLLVFVIECLAPKGRKVLSELALSRLPQRVDVVVLQVDNMPVTPTPKLRSIFDHLRRNTLIEFKGPTDDLEALDVCVLLAYAGQYMALHKVFDPEQMCLMVVADRIPKTFVKQVERMGGTFASARNGLWRGRMAGLPMHGVELRDAYKTGPSERLLYAFTKAFLTDHGPIKLLDDEDKRVYRLICEHVLQLERSRATMDLRDLQLAEQAYMSGLEELIAIATPAQRLARLTPEQRLAGLPPEQRLAGLPPEQRLAGLTPEELIAALPPEVIELIARKLKS